MLAASNNDILQRAHFGNLSGLHLAGLVRKSTPEHCDLTKQSEAHPYLTGFDLKSREQQEDDARAYVTSRKGNYIYTYDEPATSTWKRKRVKLPDGQVAYRVKRPVYEAALNDLKQGFAPNGQRLDGLIVYDIDRLTRDNRDLEDAIDVVVYHQRLIIDITGTIDLLTENGRDMARVLVTMAGKQPAATSRRITRKHLALAHAGIPTGRHRPFGWQDDKRTLHSVEAPLLAKAHHDVIQNISLNTICREWTKAGVTTTCGKFWTTSTLRYRLLSPRNAGFSTYRGEIAHDIAGKPVRGQFAPIVDDETWERVRAILTDSSRGKKVHNGGRKYLLSGIIRCTQCSRRLFGNAAPEPGKFRHICPGPPNGYGCGKTFIRGPETDNLVTDLTLAYLNNRSVNHKAAPWPEELQLTDATSQIGELMTAYHTKQLSSQIVFPQIAEIQATLDALQAERSDWLRKQNVNQNSPNKVGDLWPAMSTERRRAIIESLLLAVVVEPTAPRKRGPYDPSRVSVVWR